MENFNPNNKFLNEWRPNNPDRRPGFHLPCRKWLVLNKFKTGHEKTALMLQINGTL